MTADTCLTDTPVAGHPPNRPRLMPARQINPPYDDEAAGPAVTARPASDAPGPDGGSRTRPAAPYDALAGAVPDATPAAQVPAGPVPGAELPAGAVETGGTPAGAVPAGTVKAAAVSTAPVPACSVPAGALEVGAVGAGAVPAQRQPGARTGHGGQFHHAPGPAAVLVVRAVVEALSGIRTPGQLAGWTTPRLQADLERRMPRGTRPARCAVRSIRVSEPRPGVAEVSAVIVRGARAAALALRMESTDGRWRVTTLQVG